MGEACYVNVEPYVLVSPPSLSRINQMILFITCGASDLNILNPYWFMRRNNGGL